MKIIRIVSFFPSLSMDFHPDSALLLPGRPLFYPDFGGEWKVAPMLAVRLNRLGKSVAEKFASRYYDALAIAFGIEPADADAMAEGELSGMDTSLAHGDWMAPEEFAGLGSLAVGGVRVELPYSIADIDRAVSRVSRHTTVKMGDIVLLPLRAESCIPLAGRSRMVAMDKDGREVMNVKVV